MKYYNGKKVFSNPLVTESKYIFNPSEEKLAFYGYYPVEEPESPTDERSVPVYTLEEYSETVTDKTGTHKVSKKKYILSYE